MKLNNQELSAQQANALKELMGEPFMSDTRAETRFASICSRYRLNPTDLLKALESSPETNDGPENQTN